ncbi:MAG: hypothetical protein HY392_03490 [Candidatus Diapherotrites archaeon]|nr:hypothetical protein [Candidatus Diapherotrites archaeon]
MADEQKNKSEIIRNYAITGFFAVAAIAALGFVFLMAKFFILEDNGFSQDELWTNCEKNGEQVNVFVNANQRLESVQCIALDEAFFEQAQINLGALERSDSDVCRFTLKADTTIPTRFEIKYSNKTRRQTCSEQNSFPQTGFID